MRREDDDGWDTEDVYMYTDQLQFYTSYFHVLKHTPPLPSCSLNLPSSAAERSLLACRSQRVGAI